VIVVVVWLVTEFWVLTDALSLALGVTSLASVRIPNLKISCIILGLFFVYDIFWVFLSEYIFKKNVMVTVATGLPTLPMLIVLPRVLDNGSSMLGLGDIVLPGLFLCFLFRYDHNNYTPFKQGYFLRAWIAYGIGLILTLVMVLVLARGQPALMYLVPCTIFTTLYFGWRRKELKLLWTGKHRVNEEDVEFSNVEEDSVSLLNGPGTEESATTEK